MNREEFMNRLEYLLRGIPAGERADAIAYYNAYFDEAGAENEYQVIQELGSPEQVAQTILADVQQAAYQQTENTYSADKTTTKKKMSTSTKVLLVIVIILTFPLWIGVVAGLFGGLVGILGGLFGTVVGIGAAAIGLIVSGFFGLAVGILGALQSVMVPAVALAIIGVSAFIITIGILLALVCILLVGVWIPKLVKAIVSWIKRISHREEGGNEI